jgi:hypothetical protein
VLRICWEIVSKSMNVNNDNSNGHQTVTMTDNKTVLQALALINDCNKYKMDLTTNGVVITDAIKFVQTHKEKLNISKESKEPDYNEDKDQLEEEQEKETGELEKQEKTINRVF